MASRPEPEDAGDTPRILILDIETFPVLMYSWTIWEASALKVVEPTSVACISAKWLGGKQETMALPDFKGYRPHGRSDKKLLEWMWALLDEADWVIAHNGKRFDFKKLNARFMAHHISPPSPYTKIDTLEEVKKVAAFDSHRLNDLCRQLDIGQKMRTGGSDLWFDCLEGDGAAWKKMKKYNARDVVLLEKLYLELRPWMTGHPNHGMFTGISSCPKCGSTKLQMRGRARCVTTSYQRFQCMSCGGWSRSSERVGERASLVNAR